MVSTETMKPEDDLNDFAPLSERVGNGGKDLGIKWKRPSTRHSAVEGRFFSHVLPS